MVLSKIKERSKKKYGPAKRKIRDEEIKKDEIKKFGTHWIVPSHLLSSYFAASIVSFLHLYSLLEIHLYASWSLHVNYP